MSESEYERLSREANDRRKAHFNRANNEDNLPSEDPREAQFTLAGIMGIVFIVVGVIALIGILLSFDWSMYNELKSHASTYDEVLVLMKQDMMTTIIMAGMTLIVSVAIGSILLALDTIIKLLK